MVCLVTDMGASIYGSARNFLSLFFDAQFWMRCMLFLLLVGAWCLDFQVSEEVAEPEVPEHAALTRRGQFSIKQTIKEEKLAKKGLGKGKETATPKTGKGVGQTGKKGKGKGKKSKKETQTKKTDSKRKGCKVSGKGGKGKTSKKRRILKARAGTKKQKAGVAPETQVEVAVESPVPTGAPEDLDANEDLGANAEVTSSGKPARGKGGRKRKTPVQEVPVPAPEEEHVCENQGGKKKAPARKRQPRMHATVSSPDAKISKTMLAILTDCENSEYCHEAHPDECPWAEDPDFEQVQFSVYWSRNAVGVKVPSSTVCPPAEQQKKGQHGKKTQAAKKSPWAQVVYFAQGWCVQCNCVLAFEWVAWFRILSCMQHVGLYGRIFGDYTSFLFFCMFSRPQTATQCVHCGGVYS